MAAKRPKGELPKRTSGYADYLKERRPNISKSAAAAQAGRVRDAGYDTSAFKKTAKDKNLSQIKKTNADKPARSKSGASALKEVTKRFGITAREARDIATAVSTAAKVTARTGAGKTTWARPSQIAEVAKQVKEVGVAAATGKKGTSAGQTKKQFGETYYNKGKKRK